MTRPTKLQLKVLLYCKQQKKFPSPPQIAVHFGWDSDNSARVHLKALHRKGLLSKVGAKYKVSVN